MQFAVMVMTSGLLALCRDLTCSPLVNYCAHTSSPGDPGNTLCPPCPLVTPFGIKGHSMHVGYSIVTTAITGEIDNLQYVVPEMGL